MRAMSVADLLQKSEHDLSEDRQMVIAIPRRERPSERPRPSLTQLINEEKRALDCAMRGCRSLTALPKSHPKGERAERLSYAASRDALRNSSEVLRGLSIAALAQAQSCLSSSSIVVGERSRPIKRAMDCLRFTHKNLLRV
jgi:hypothetical protein